MFDSLSDKLQGVFSGLRGKGKLTEADIDQAMRAITVDAAYVLGMEHEIGSLRAGKKADFTVLEADPYETAPGDLKDIPIWGTVFEGTPAPLA